MTQRWEERDEDQETCMTAQLKNLYCAIHKGQASSVKSFLSWYEEDKVEEYRPLHSLLKVATVGTSAFGSRNDHKLSPAIQNFVVSKLTALHVAVLYKREEIVKLLLPEGVDKFDLLSRKTSEGWTALHIAAVHGDEKVVRLLMQAYGMSKKKDIDMQDHLFMTPLHYACWGGKFPVVNEMLKWDEKGEIINLRAVNLFLSTPLHITAMPPPAKGTKEHVIYRARYRIALSIIRRLQKLSPNFSAVLDDIQEANSPLNPDAADFDGDMEADVINAVDCCSYTTLHWAVQSNAVKIVELLTLNPKIEPLIEDWEQVGPLHIAIRDEQFQCENLLLLNEKVRCKNDRLLHDRQVCVDSANAILVGASLIAGITFGAYLQPPFGLVTYYEYGAYEASPPTDFRSYAAVEKDKVVQAFWVFNCLSFLSAIATVLASSLTVARSTVWEPQEHLGDLVRRNKRWVLLTYFLFTFSILSVLGAFIVVGIGVLPPPLKVRLVNFVYPSLFPLALCTIILFFFIRKPSSIRKIIVDPKKRDWTWGKRLQAFFRSRFGSLCKSGSKASKSVHERMKCDVLKDSIGQLAKSTSTITTKYIMDHVYSNKNLYHKRWSCHQCRLEAVDHVHVAYSRIDELYNLGNKLDLEMS